MPSQLPLLQAEHTQLS